MRAIEKRLLTVLAAAALLGAAGTGTDGKVKRLASWMAGFFTSGRQAASDTEFRDVHLHVAPIWTERRDGPWLYVEQAVASTPERPYRQRVYRLVRAGSDRIESHVYEIPDPLRLAGAWREPMPLSSLRPEDLVLRSGCEVTLRYDKKTKEFAGSTTGKRCRSDLRGARYATSEVRIDAEGITSWDRGFDESDRQVWGAEKGPYVFVKEP